MKKIALFGFLLTAVIVFSLNVHAATFSQEMNLTVTVNGTCTITSYDIAFPDYSIGSTQAISGTGTLNVDCAEGLPYSIELDNGNNFSGGRHMSDGGNTLEYDVCQDAGCQTPWGTGTQAYTGSGGTTPVDLTVHGIILPDQVVPAGNYTDIVTCTVTF